MNPNENLRTRTQEFSLRIINLYTVLPRTGATRVMGDQVLRSGTAVGANYAEACHPKSTADFVHKIGSAMQELEETRYWLDLLVAGKFMTAKRMSKLQNEVDQLMAIFATMIKNSKSSHK